MESLERVAYPVPFQAENALQKVQQSPDAHDRSEEKQEAEKKAVRKAIFLHITGIAMAPTLYALWEKGVFSIFELGKFVSLDDVLSHVSGNAGYLNVAFRLMVTQGWMERQEVDGQYQYALTRKGSVAVELTPAYRDVVALLPVLDQIDRYLLQPQAQASDIDFANLLERAVRAWDLVESPNEDYQEVRSNFLYHLNGLLIGPVMVALAMVGVFERFDVNQTLRLDQIEGNLEILHQAFELLKLQGWVTKQGHHVQLTSSGAYATSRAYAYGVTVSYLPTFARVPDLLFGDPAILWQRDAEGHETHVNRKTNVWGSGQAHKTYFKKVDAAIIDIFNRPIEQQPKGVVDMGCGDGTFMEHIYHVVKNNTERGRVLDQYPLVMVCADYNRASREVTESRLQHLADTCNVVFGDINDPDSFTESLENDHQIQSEQFLHVRSFLDHNRPFIEPMMREMGCELKSGGAYACQGRLIQGEELLQNLIEHFKRWARNIGQFGLLVLDLHTISPELAAQNVGLTLVTAYDATHGYTDQYPVELSQFLAAAAAAGLTPDLRYQSRFPPNDLATISLNLFVPTPDLQMS